VLFFLLKNRNPQQPLLNLEGTFNRFLGGIKNGETIPKGTLVQKYLKI